MDDLVKQAMHKWPNVPDCYGWLGLDVRGQWYMRDDRVQALGSFQSGLAKGAWLQHEKLKDFIVRNYESDAQGRWYFQNGPQRVYVELERTPLICRVNAQGQVTAHTGAALQVRACLLDEQGHLYLESNIGLGLVHSMDMLQAVEQIEQGRWQVQSCERATLPQRYGYVLSPQANACEHSGEPKSNIAGIKKPT